MTTWVDVPIYQAITAQYTIAVFRHSILCTYQPNDEYDKHTQHINHDHHFKVRGPGSSLLLQLFLQLLPHPLGAEQLDGLHLRSL